MAESIHYLIVNRHLLLFIPACATITLLTSPLHAAVSVPVLLVADAFVSSAAPSSNYGAAGALAISAPGSSKGEFQTLMLLDFSSAKSTLDSTFGVGGWVADSLSIQLTGTSPNNGIFNASVAGTLALRWFNNDTWTEGNGKPGTASTNGGVIFNDLTGLLTSGTQSLGTVAYGGGTSGINTPLTLSNGLLADVMGGSTASLDLYAGDATMSGVFNSINNTTPANRPVFTLVASAVPEPSGAALSLLALSASLIRRRR